ncbi:hypothetical protein V6N13_114587 [Hibiscus sabdariffa]|uniref:Uncharacterized protein n=1 Tax=Hibiscus sabdariffa TaxID=183260 RepID=A0ABR2U2I4_9ROSI
MRRMASSITARGVAATVGIGPKLGRSVAHKFAYERYTVAILARDLGRLSRFVDEIAREEKTFTDIKTDFLEKSLAISFLDAFLCTQQEGAFWDGEKAKMNDSFHWLISFALWHL